MTDDPIFDDPFFIATVNAQTRAMNKFNGEYVHLERERTKKLYYEVASRLRPGAKVVHVLEFILNLNEPFTNDAERGGYKIALGMALYEVRRKKNLEFEEFERSRPFILSETEQDT